MREHVFTVPEKLPDEQIDYIAKNLAEALGQVECGEPIHGVCIMLATVALALENTRQK